MTPRRGQVALLACLLHATLGVIAASLGPSLGDLAPAAHVSLGAIGVVFTAVFVGSSVAQLVAGGVADRAPAPVVVATGCALLGTGTTALALGGNLTVIVVASALLGLGGGTTIIGANVVVASAFAPNSASALNGANAFFGVGALLGPLIAGVSLAAGGDALWALRIGGTLALALALTAIVALPNLARPDPSSRRSPYQTLRSPLLWVFAAILFWYVGLETGVGGWSVIYLGRTADLDAAAGAFVTSAYWAALAAGRFAGAIVGRRLDAGRLLRFSILGCVIGAALLLVGHGSLPVTVAATLLLGFCFGPVYPTVLGMVITLYRQAPGAATGIVTALGSVGGMILPVAQGAALDGAGTRAAAAFVALGVLALLAVDIARSRSGLKA